MHGGEFLSLMWFRIADRVVNIKKKNPFVTYHEHFIVCNEYSQSPPKDLHITMIKYERVRQLACLFLLQKDFPTFTILIPFENKF